MKTIWKFPLELTGLQLTDFRVGQKVVCVNPDFDGRGILKRDQIYTIRCVTAWVDLEEISGGWCHSRFRIVPDLHSDDRAAGFVPLSPPMPSQAVLTRLTSLKNPAFPARAMRTGANWRFR